MNFLYTLIETADKTAVVTVSGGRDPLLVSSGGACATTVTAALVSVLPAAIGGNLRIDEKVIFLYEPYFEGMAPSEVRAIVAHEEAHCFLGHLKEIQTDGGPGVYVNNRNEMEADAYAADRFGAKNVRKAFVRLLMNQLKVEIANLPAEKTPSPQKIKTAKRLMVESMKTRFDNLRVIQKHTP